MVNIIAYSPATLRWFAVRERRQLERMLPNYVTAYMNVNGLCRGVIIANHCLSTDEIANIMRILNKRKYIVDRIMDHQGRTIIWIWKPVQ